MQNLAKLAGNLWIYLRHKLQKKKFNFNSLRCHHLSFKEVMHERIDLLDT